MADVVPGQSGRDVRRLGELLASCELLSEEYVEDTYSPALRRAIDTWNKQSQHPADGIFRTGDTMFALSGSRASEVVVVAGASVAPGDTIASLEPTVASVSITQAGEASLAPLAEKTTILRFGEQAVELSDFGTVEDIPAMMAVIERAVLDGSAEVQRDGNTRIYSGGVIELAAPERLGTVPNTAVYIGEHGELCVFADGQGREGSVFALVNPKPGASALGATLVSPDLIGMRLLTNYRDASDSQRQQCES